MKCIVGCSGFSYKEWKNVFYPEKLPQSKWFAFYCEHFNSLELNVTFYRFPEIKVLRKWYDTSPDHFIFTVKAPRVITHYKRLKETEELVKDFYNNCKEGLSEKLGPLLFQFPPTFIYTEENLSLIIKSLDTAYTNIVEFRHISWWDKDLYNTLAKNNITFAGISHPTLPAAIIINNKTAYYRFHGVPKLFYSEYEEKALINIANEILLNNDIEKIFFYFNNTASSAGVNNARFLQQYINETINYFS